jgi:hypothetical protein
MISNMSNLVKGRSGACFPAGAARRHCGTTTIQGTPKRSVSMPKAGEKKVLVKRICVSPPSASAAKTRSASSSVLAL